MINYYVTYVVRLPVLFCGVVFSWVFLLFFFTVYPHNAVDSSSSPFSREHILLKVDPRCGPKLGGQGDGEIYRAFSLYKKGSF